MIWKSQEARNLFYSVPYCISIPLRKIVYNLIKTLGSYLISLKVKFWLSKNIGIIINEKEIKINSFEEDINFYIIKAKNLYYFTFPRITEGAE